MANNCHVLMFNSNIYFLICLEPKEDKVLEVVYPYNPFFFSFFGKKLYPSFKYVG